MVSFVKPLNKNPVVEVRRTSARFSLLKDEVDRRALRSRDSQGSGFQGPVAMRLLGCTGFRV